MKRNLFFQQIYICVLLLCASSAISARTLLNSLQFKPYMGLEYQYEHIKPALNYRNILSASAQTGNFFVGTRFLKALGLEVGCYRTLSVAQQQTVTTSFNGVPDAAPTAVLSRSSFKGFSIDFAGYVPLDPNFNVSFIGGFVTMHPTITFETPGGTNTALGRAFMAIKTKNRTVPRLGMGLELLKQHWGLRSRIFWVYTQDIQFNVQAAQTFYPSITPNPYVQAIQITAGIFYRF